MGELEFKRFSEESCYRLSLIAIGGAQFENDFVAGKPEFFNFLNGCFAKIVTRCDSSG